MTEGKIPADPNKYRYIDALRGYAILGVVAVHAYNLASVRPTGAFMTALFQNAARGVQLFYIVSTVTLFLSQSRRSERESHPTVNFFIRRFFRIVPMFWAGVVFYNVFVTPQPIPVLRVALLTFGFYPDTINSVFPGSWSVAVESSFYVIFPLMFMTIRSIWSALAWLVATVLAAHFTYGLYQQQVFPGLNGTLLAENFKFLWIGNQLPVFALGSVVYFMIKGRAPGQRPKLGLVLVALAVLITIPCLMMPDGGYYGLRGGIPLLSLLHPYMPACAGLALFVLGMFFLNDRVLSNGAMVLLGRVSYSFYILNMFVVGHVLWLRPAFQNVWLLLPASLVAGTALSYVTYRAIELPSIACGRRLIGALWRKPAGQTQELGARAP